MPVGYAWCHRAQCHPEGRAWLDLGVSHLVLIASACCLPAVGLHELTSKKESYLQGQEPVRIRQEDVYTRPDLEGVH